MALLRVFALVVLLVDLHGLSYGETSEVLELPIETVRSRISQGRALTRGTLPKIPMAAAGLEEGQKLFRIEK